MLSTPHVLIGAAIGSLISSPVLAFIAGVASHHFFDLVPHWDPASWHDRAKDFTWTKRDYLVAYIDNLIAFALMAIIYWWWRGSYYQVSVLAGMLGAIMPDLWHNVPFWNRLTRSITKPWLNFHRRWHHTLQQRDWWIGLLIAVVTSVISILVLTSMK